MLADHAQVFARLYGDGRWNDQQPGSTMEATRPYRAFVEQLIVEHDVRSVLDAGCGLAGYPRAIDWKGARYVGLDVVPGVIETNRSRFPDVELVEGDARRLDAHGGFDLLLIKDVLQHWSLESVRAFFAQPALASFKHVLIVNCDDERNDNADIADGDWRPLNLLALPEARKGARAVFRFGTKRVIYWGPRLTARALLDRFEWWIINLDRRPDRLRHAREQLARIGVTGARRFQGFDGQRLRLTSQRPDWVRPGAVGCYLSHAAVLKQAQARRVPCAIVEDDLVLADDFLDAFTAFLDEVPEDWDVLHLPGGEDCAPPLALGPNHSRLVGTWGTTMSFLRLPAIDRMLDEVDSLDRPIDDFYIRMMPSLGFYSPARKIVWQEWGLGTNLQEA